MPLLPNTCHSQNNDQSTFKLGSGSEGCSPKMCADALNDEGEGQVWGGREFFIENQLVRIRYITGVIKRPSLVPWEV